MRELHKLIGSYFFRRGKTTLVFCALSIPFCALLQGSTTVKVSSVTSTQAVLQVDTTNAKRACLYEVSELPTFRPVHDLDPVLFLHANSDERNGVASLALNRRVFVAGSRKVETAQDGRRYSRALQAATLHYYRVSCGSDVVTGRFTTVNPPLGNSYPELPGFDPASFGNLADPSVDWADASQAYIDPLTGIRLQRVTGPGEHGTLVQPAPFDYVFDKKGAWSNAAAAAGREPGALASTATGNAPLFLAWNELHNFQLNWSGANFNPYQGTVDDLRVRLFGSGAGASLSMCISIDGGQTCASKVLPVRLPEGAAQSVQPEPAAYPSAVFAGWGTAFSDWEISNRSAARGASAAANSRIVTATPGSFNVDWPSGVKIRLPGSGCPGGDVCTVASVQNTGQLTTQETISNTVGDRPWQAYAAGILVWLDSGSRASISGTYEYAQSVQSILNDNPSQAYCSELKVEDIYKDRHGNPLASPMSGRLCNFGHGLYLAVDGTGEFRLLSNFFMNSRSPLPYQPVNLPTSGSFSTSDPKTLYGNVYYNDGIFRGVYTGDYAPYKAGGSTGYISDKPADDNILWTNIMPAGSAADVSTQLQAYPSLTSATSGLFGAPSFSGLLDGYGQFVLGPLTGGDPICVVVRYNLESRTIRQVLPSWTTWPMRWGGCHFSPHGGGSFQIAAFNPINGKNPGAPLNGPFQLKLTQVKKDGTWRDNTAMSESVVRFASNTSPVIITTVSTYTDVGFMTSNNHGFIDGEPVMLWGAGSNSVINTGANQSFYVKASWSDTSLKAPLGSGDTTIQVVDGSRITANPMLRIDSELVRCDVISGDKLSGCVRGSSGSAAAPHAIGAAARQANSFAIYRDRALTQPLAGSGDYAFNFKTFVMDLDPCPANLDPRWTQQMFGDSGASGRRCNTIRVAGEPYSNYAYWSKFTVGGGLESITVAGGRATVKLSQPFAGWSAGQQISISGANLAALNATFPISRVIDPRTVEFAVAGLADGVHAESGLALKHATEHYRFPWKGEPGNLDKSSLQDLQEGDFLHDLGHGQFGEQMVIVQKKKNGETDIELTVMRYYGDKVACESHDSNSSPITHPDGWTPYLVPSYGCPEAQAYADIADTAWRIGNYHLAEEHGDIGPGSAPGLFSYVSSGGNTPIANLSFQEIMNAPFTSGIIRELPVFAGSAASLPYGYTTQGYGAFRQTTAKPQEKVWKADFHALNNSFGAQQDVPLGLTSGMTFAAVPGTEAVYRVTSMPSKLDHKRLPLLGFAGYHYMADMSGPGSVITDANRYRFCVADFAGECRPGSAQGDVYAAIPGADLETGGWCITNSYEHNVPCLFTANSYGGWAVQQQFDPPDTTGKRGRRLTMGFVNPGRHFTFSNWVPSPDAQWGFLSIPWMNGVRNDIYAMKLPPWPVSDSVDRSGFVTLPVVVKAVPGAFTARALFGYSENGPAEGYFCTQRKETCTTAGSPFAWLSESQQPQACSSGCTVTIPAIAGRVVNYAIQWLDANGQVILAGPANSAAAP